MMRVLPILLLCAAAGAAMPTNGTPHLVEVAFPVPVAADELYLGGHPATPAWNRAWQGRVFEALFCFGEPSATDMDALRSYLSLRWALGLSFPSTPDHPLSFGLSWNNVVVEQHYVNDVIPFLRAISLDGNPGIYNDRYVPTNLTRPCLYQGQNLDDYISRRPTLPTGTTP